MFIAPLFIIAKTWKQRRCPSVGEWIDKLVHPENGILLSTKKSYQAMKRHGKQLSVYCSEKEASLKRLHTVIPTIKHFGKGKSVEINKKINSWQGLGEKKG